MNHTPVEVHVYITSTLNNTHLCLLHPKTNHCFFNSSSGCYEKVKSKRSSAVAAFQLSEVASKFARSSGFSTCAVFFKGFGKGRSGVLKGLVLGGLNIYKVYHVNSLAFNGCRQRKKKRLLFFYSFCYILSGDYLFTFLLLLFNTMLFSRDLYAPFC